MSNTDLINENSECFFFNLPSYILIFYLKFCLRFTILILPRYTLKDQGSVRIISHFAATNTWHQYSENSLNTIKLSCCGLVIALLLLYIILFFGFTDTSIYCLFILQTLSNTVEEKAKWIFDKLKGKRLMY